MTDFSQYFDRPNVRRARFDPVLGRVGALRGKFQAFFNKEENRTELRRLIFVFSIQYALVGLFVVAVIGFVSAQLNIQ